jgi:single-strand DNA-binding protein
MSTNRSSTTADAPAASLNLAVLRGVLAGEPLVTDLPDGRTVHNFEVRADVGDHRTMVPVAWHDPVRPPRLAQGDLVVVVGAVRRRWFRAGGGSQSRTEVVAADVARVGTARAQRALASAAAAVGATVVEGE